MPNPEQQNISNLQTFENEAALTRAEIEAFNKLPKKEQKKQEQERLAKLLELQDKLEQAVIDGAKAGNFDEAKKLKEEIEKEILDLNVLLSAKHEKIKEILFDPNDIFTSSDWAKLQIEANCGGDKIIANASIAIINREKLSEVDKQKCSSLVKDSYTQQLAWWMYAFPDFKKTSKALIEKSIKDGEERILRCRNNNDWRHLVEPAAWLTILGHKPNLTEEDFENVETELRKHATDDGHTFYFIEMAAAMSIIYPDYPLDLEISEQLNKKMAETVKAWVDDNGHSSAEWYMISAMAKIVADKLREIIFKKVFG